MFWRTFYVFLFVSLLAVDVSLASKVPLSVVDTVKDEMMNVAEEIDDPCRTKFCGAGRECHITSEGNAKCICVPECSDEEDTRRRVCSNLNETWSSDCELYRQRCLCADEDESCKADKYAHMHIDYYGQCQQMPECNEEELRDFPRRMREWLFNIMRDLADRNMLSSYYLSLEKEAEEDSTRKWSNAVVWKWCDLDGHPRDSAVSRHELFPLRAPLYTLEHCIAPFLDSCDPDDDHRITLKEWTACLELDEDESSAMEDLCEEIGDY